MTKEETNGQEPERDRVGSKASLEVIRWFLLGSFKVFFRMRVRDVKNCPMKGPLLVASNHASHADPVFLGGTVPRRIRFLARSSLFRSRPFRALIQFFGAVPIEREGIGLGGIRKTVDLLREESAVIVFPEGTRSRDGTIGKLQGGLATIAKRSGAPILPVWIDGSHRVLPRGTKWPRPTKVEVRYGRAFRVPVELDTDRVLEIVREQWLALANGDPIPEPGGQVPIAATASQKRESIAAPSAAK